MAELSPWYWAAFFAFVALMLALDLGLLAFILAVLAVAIGASFVREQRLSSATEARLGHGAE